MSVCRGPLAVGRGSTVWTMARLRATGRRPINRTEVKSRTQLALLEVLAPLQTRKIRRHNGTKVMAVTLIDQLAHLGRFGRSMDTTHGVPIVAVLFFFEPLLPWSERRVLKEHTRQAGQQGLVESVIDFARLPRIRQVLEKRRQGMT
jgi:hypothetical protein